MKWVRGLLMFALSLCLGVAMSSAQSLADVAKKEKSRRSKTAKTTKTITERELAQSYGGLRAAPSSSTTSGDDEEDGAEGDDSTEVDETQTREHWQTRVTGVNQRIQELEARLDSEEFNWGEGLRAGSDPYGGNNVTRRQTVERDLAAARAELAAIQEEARRANVPAGWVR